MASLNSVTIDLKVKGEATATRSLKDFAKAGGSVETGVTRLANKVSAAEKEWARLDAMLKQGIITENARKTAQKQLAAQMALLTGLTKEQAAAALKNAEASRIAAEEAKKKAAAEASAAQSYRQLKASIDPVYASQERLRQGIQAIRAAQRAKVISTQEAITALRQLRAAQDAAAAGANFASRGLNRTGVVAQQAGYQIGDFFVQIQSGTSAMVAFGQQMTQLVGTFAMFARTTRAAMIASGIGIFVSIATAVGASIMRMNGEMDTLDTKIQKLETSFNELNESLSRLNDEDLNQIFGNMADDVRDMTSAMVELNNVAALNNLTATFEKMEDVSSAGLMRHMGEGALNILRVLGLRQHDIGEGLFGYKSVREVNEDAYETLGFNMARSQFNAYIEEFEKLASSGDVAGVTSLAATFLEDATDGSAQISIEGIALARSIEAAALLAAEFAAEQNGSAEAARQAAAAQEAFEESVRASAVAYREVREAADERGVLGLINRTTAALDEVDAAQEAFEESVRASAAAYREVRAEADERGLLGLINRMTASLDEVDAAQEGVLNLVKMTRDAYAASAAEQDRIAATADATYQAEERNFLQRIRLLSVELDHGRDSAEYLKEQRDIRNEILANSLREAGVDQTLIDSLIDRISLEDDLVDAIEAKREAEAQAAIEAQQAAIAAQAALDAIIEAQEPYTKLADEIGRGAANALVLAGVDLTDGVDAATKAAAVLADNLGIALRNAIAIMELGPIAGAAAYNVPGAGAGPFAGAGSVPGGDRNDYTPPVSPLSITDVFTLPEIPTGSGAGAGAAGYTGIFPGLQAQVEAAMKQTRAYQDEIKLLDSALEQGLITQQEYNSYVAQAQEYYNQAADAASNYEEVLLTMANTASDAIGDAMMSIVDGTKSASDAFSDMARIILKKAFELAVINPILNAIFGTSGLNISGFNPLPAIGQLEAKGGVWSGGSKVTAFATGGVVGSPTFFPMANGNVGLMGEAGPEAIMPLKRGKGGRLGVEVSGEQGNVTINQTFAFQANGDDSVKRIIAEEAPKIAALTQKQMLDARRRGGVVRDTFA